MDIDELKELAGMGESENIEIWNGYPEPVFKEQAGAVGVIFSIKESAGGSTPTDTGAQKAQVQNSPLLKEILTICRTPKRSSEIIESLGYKKKSGGLKKNLSFLLSTGLLRYTIPEKPRSRNQMYITTEKGSEVLQKMDIP